MANILYITSDFYLKNKWAGGMGTKTEAIQSAWGIDHKIDVAPEPDPEKHEHVDVVLIELLGLRNDNKLEERIRMLKACTVPKFVYGSDSEIFRWTGKELDALKEIVTLWIPNTKWQGDYFCDFDLSVTHIVHEPINCDLFRPSKEMKKVIIAGGAVSFEKQAEFFIALFSELSKMNTGEYETAYLGSANLWGDYKAINFELQRELEVVTDNFYGSVPQSKVASVLGEAALGVLNPHYETCNRFHQEMMASGKPVVCGKHILYDERPVTARFDSSVQDCIEKLAELTNNFEALPDKAHATDAREFAVQHFSYEASIEQLNQILRGIV